MTFKEIIQHTFSPIGIHSWYTIDELIYHSDNGRFILGSSAKCIDPYDWASRGMEARFYSQGVKFWKKIPYNKEIPKECLTGKFQLFIYITVDALYILEENFNYKSPTERWLPLKLNFINETNLQKVQIIL
jgi:hypothetical protein